MDTGVWSEMRTELWPDTSDCHLSEIGEYFDGNSIVIRQVYVIEQGQEIVGFIELNVRNYAEGSRNASVPYVEGWYVKPAFQGMGYGTYLMKQAESWALSLGFDEIASDAEVDNEASIRLHKKLGFGETDRIVCLLKALNAGQK
ncbi:MAG: GNAT family N-acetyltransferase [Pseudomonadota bacterium]